jgi:hypothetical protein
MYGYDARATIAETRDIVKPKLLLRPSLMRYRLPIGLGSEPRGTSTLRPRARPYIEYATNGRKSITDEYSITLLFMDVREITAASIGSDSAVNRK